MKKVAVITTTRAEYGLLSPIIKRLRDLENKFFRVELIVSGTHLNYEYGHTIDEIIKDDVRIDEQIVIPVDSKNAYEISSNQSETLKVFTKLFLEKNYNGIIILGDRYEMLAIAIAAGNTHTPIFHISGGDTTEGAMDEWIRHCITKISYIHFTTNEESYKRVIQLGESPDRVYNYGSTSIDNILNIANLSKKEALESISLNDCDYALCTYHPVTMENGNVKEQINSFLNAIKKFTNIEFIITKSNADQGGLEINHLLDIADQEIDNVHVFSSLGVKRYLSLMKYSKFVLGNSSSGIVETPAFHIPTVNIGDRQLGRLQSKSVINCNDDTNSIIEGINKALDPDFRKNCETVISPYGKGDSSLKVSNKVYEVVMNNEINLKKSFYNIEDVK